MKFLHENYIYDTDKATELFRLVGVPGFESPALLTVYKAAKGKRFAVADDRIIDLYINSAFTVAGTTSCAEYWIRSSNEPIERKIEMLRLIGLDLVEA